MTSTHLVMDGHDASHDVNDPLRVDDDFLAQKLALEMLHGAEIVKEADRLRHLHRLNCVTFFDTDYS